MKYVSNTLSLENAEISAISNAGFGAGGGGLTNINVSAGTTSNNLSNLVFGNGNGVSFGLNGSTVTGSHNGLTSQSNQAFSANGGSSAFQTLSFADANGITWSNNGGSVQAFSQTHYINVAQDMVVTLTKR